VSRYAKRRMAALDRERWHDHWWRFRGSRPAPEFVARDQRIAVPSDEQLAEVLARMASRRRPTS